MEDLTKKTNELNALYQEKIAALDTQRVESKKALNQVHEREEVAAVKEQELLTREGAVSGIEYQQDLIAKNESMIRANSAARDELSETIASLGNQKIEWNKERTAQLQEIEVERDLQKRNSAAVKERETELTQKIAEFNAKIKAIGV
jgi:hypothetical protein